ncbi:hypothetical protein C8Q74DRAFT_566042 [Fomes fomentarius]|nr:hypothetical protein C8Q74DRAFT_566042 [Fomes fomentarius]
MDACHISLAQPHILDEIFASFSGIPLLLSAHTPKREQLQTNKSTLANAALTCRAFVEPASAVLWSAMHSGLRPLLFTLSNFKPYSGEAKNVIEGGVSPSEWARFQVLARRIQYLSNWNSIDLSALRLLLKQCSERPLLPNLRVLRWTCYSQFYAACDMAIFARVCPGLRDLVIDADAADDVDEIPPKTYSSFQGLRSARVLLTQPTHLRELAMLPHLESLFLNSPSILCMDDVVLVEDTSTITPAFHGFPALRTLEVSGYFDPSLVAGILHTITSPILSVVIFRIDLGRGGSEGLDRLIGTLCAVPAAQQLRTFHVLPPPGRMHLPAQQYDWRWELSFKEYARPLLQLHNLRDVSLGPTWRIWSITDNDVRAMQQAWPHIQSLEMKSFFSSPFIQRCQPSGVFVDRPALSTLVFCAQNCRDLKTLKMECREIGEDELAELDTRAAAIELEESAYGTGSEPPQLQELIVRVRGGIFHQPCPEMSGDNVGRLTRALRRLFPHLEEIQNR